jgi:hypothetical protein
VKLSNESIEINTASLVSHDSRITERLDGASAVYARSFCRFSIKHDYLLISPMDGNNKPLKALTD